ncbi:MAG: tetratricopeptide repeat protein [Anaerolineales bacterium]
MKNAVERKTIYYLSAAFTFWMLLMVLFPIAQGMLALRISNQFLLQNKLLQAAQLRLQASKGLFWQSEELIEQAGRISLQAQQAEISIEMLRPLYVRHHLSDLGKLTLAQAYAQVGYITMANQLRQELADSGYLPLILYPMLLERFQSTRQFFEANQTLQKLMLLQPNFPFWRYRYGLILLTSQPEEAKKILREVVASDINYKENIDKLLDPLMRSQSRDMSYQLLQAGRGLASIGEWTLAEEAFVRAVSLRPDYAEAWAYLGLAKMHANNKLNFVRSKAIKEGFLINKGEEADQFDKDKILEQNGLAEIRQALRINPQSQAALAFETQYWLERGNSKQALQAARRAIRVYPSEEYNFEQYAQALILNGELDSAWQIYRLLVESSTDKEKAEKVLLRFDIQNNFLLQEEALPLARQLTYQHPGDLESLDLLALVLFSLHYDQRAQELLERVIRLEPDNAAAHLHLALVLLDQGQRELAYHELTQAIALTDNDSIEEQAQRLLIYITP